MTAAASSTTGETRLKACASALIRDDPFHDLALDQVKSEQDRLHN
ncbi:MAG: hypothetical protein VX875_06360 [Pseudomonadota bacterium]|nr:hypothetical protein [Pseudomonadota bacterium]